MNQEKMVQDFINTQTVGWLDEDLLAMVRAFPDKQEQITADLSAAVAEICREASLLQEAGSKGPAAWLSISFLRTNILDDRWQYRLDLYDEKFYVDRTECAGCWNMDFAWDYLRQRLAVFAETINSSIYANKIKANHVDELTLALAAQYHLEAVDFVKQIIETAIAIPEYIALTKTPNLKIIMGEYMDQNVMIYQAQPDQMER